MKTNNLLDIPAGKLLEKFGAGRHIPGSGSAAALKGMLATQLLITVIELTKEKKKYKAIFPQLNEMNDRINRRIFPELKKLFHKDAIQFDKVIKAREERDNNKNLYEINSLAKKALTELKKAVDIPIEIAHLCLELAEIADFVFDNGFQSARGDSQVALSGAVAAIAGCLSIIKFNLLSYGSDEYLWTSEIYLKIESLKKEFKRLNKISNDKVEKLAKEVSDRRKLYKEVNAFQDKLKTKNTFTNNEIENAASDFQNLLWKYRFTIWQDEIPEHPAKILQVKTVFKKVLAFNFEVVGNLDIIDDENSRIETAGIIDQQDRLVLISNRFDKNIQNFTAAHELGHALLHKQTILHRDRPINGEIRIERNLVERQADKFASCFLMPAKVIKNEFIDIFGTNKFIINELTAFNLIADSPIKLRKDYRNLRDLSRKLASCERYNHRNFISLAELFDVSVTAMAIRLEELGLVEY